MNILMIPSFFYTKELPTLGSFFLDQAVALQKAGHNVIIVYPDVYSSKFIGSFFSYKEKDETINGIRVLRDKYFAPFKHGIKGCCRSFTNGCLDIIKNKLPGNFKIDILHAQNCVWAGRTAYLIEKKFGIPYIITEHSSMYGYSFKAITPSIKKLCIQSFEKAKKTICVSRTLQKNLSPYCNNSIVIGNIVDTDTYFPLSKEKKNTDFVFLSTAYLTVESRVKLKGIDTVLRAACILKRKGVKFKYKIIGVPKNFSYLHDFVVANGLEDEVSLVPPSSREIIADEMRKSDCFILPSLYETFGLVFAEALSSGIPIIATDVGIVSEIISENNGIICKKNDVSSVADSMIRIMNMDLDSPVLMHKAIEESYSETEIVKKIIDVYKECK